MWGWDGWETTKKRAGILHGHAGFLGDSSGILAKNPGFLCFGASKTGSFRRDSIPRLTPFIILKRGIRDFGEVSEGGAGGTGGVGRALLEFYQGVFRPPSPFSIPPRPIYPKQAPSPPPPPSCAHAVSQPDFQPDFWQKSGSPVRPFRIFPLPFSTSLFVGKREVDLFQTSGSSETENKGKLLYRY